VIDLHSHVLHGLDDGARTLDDSVAMVEAAAADGVRVLAATPHVRADYPTSADDVERRLGELRAAVAAAGTEVELVGGGELSLRAAARLDAAELRRFALGGGALLLEFPYHGWPLDLELRLYELRAHGFRTLLAHPERNTEVADRPERLCPLVASGAHVQVTAGSLAGTLGRSAERTGRALLALGVVHCVATDAHAATGRSRLSSVAESVGDASLARWLTLVAPAAILAGEPLPAAPRWQPKRGRVRLLGRSAGGRA
jgi:protein-tyrosine phosphatase